jgi:LmbE family N-acetylglucosaminyl deacetylase
VSALCDLLAGRLRQTFLQDALLKAAERRQGISYPGNLVGRHFRDVGSMQGGVFVIAAHPDDETLGLGLTLIKHRSRGEHVSVLFTTNGAGGDWAGGRVAQEARSAERLQEASNALGLIGIAPPNIMCLGFPDGGLRRYLREAASDIMLLIDRCRPQMIYVHAIEGGHSDHDFTSFIVQQTAAKLRYDDVYEWPEYNRDCPLDLSLTELRFASDPCVSDFSWWRVCPAAPADLELKNEMLCRYASQAYVMKRYPRNSELLRRATPVELVQRLKYFTNLSSITLRYLGAHAIARTTP